MPDPGYSCTGDVASLAVVVNEPVRRWRVAGTDLLLDMARHVPVDVYGMGMDALRERALADGVPSLASRLHEDLPQARLHQRLGRHRAYFHPYRWTSLGLALLEAMTCGLPVLALVDDRGPRGRPAGGGAGDVRPRRAPRDRPAVAATTRPRRANAAGRRGSTRSPATASSGSSTTGTGSWKG